MKPPGSPGFCSDRNRHRAPRYRRRLAVGTVLLALAGWCLGVFPALAQTSSGTVDDPLPPAGPSCAPSQPVRILFLLDVSKSLKWNDPDSNRIEGTLRAVSDLVTRARNDGPEQRSRYGGWSLQVAVDTFANEYQRGDDWEYLVESEADLATAAEDLRQAARRLEEAVVAAAPSGSRTDYREALAGAVERFGDPGGRGACNLLFWFTDGEHDTQGSSPYLSNREKREIDDMCLTDGVVAELRRSGIWVNVIELTADRASTEILPRLVGAGEECEGLDEQVIGQVITVATASDLVDEIEEVVYDVWPRTPVEYLPCSPPERRFVLSEDLEEIRVYVDLTRVADPAAVVLELREPGGYPFPISFTDGWERIPGTGFLGWKPTRSARELRAHQISRDLFRTVWGEDQEWTLICSGPGHERAGIAIEKIEVEKSKVVQLERIADNLVGQVAPLPEEGETVLVSVRIGGEGPGSGRTLDLDERRRRVEPNGRFTIPGISGRIQETMGGTDGCEAEIEVSVTELVKYGAESRFWNVPGSAATRNVDFCQSPLAEAEVEIDEETRPDPAAGVSPALTVTARAGYLDSSLTVTAVETDPPVAISPPAWRCAVPANVDEQCDPLNLRVDTSAAPDTRTVTDLTVTIESKAEDQDRSDAGAHLITDFPIPGRLPHPDDVRVDATGNGVLRVSARGGLLDAELEIVDIDPADIRATDPAWRCRVPREADDHTCQEDVRLLAHGENAAATTLLVVTIRAYPTGSDQPEWVREYPVSLDATDLPGALPSVTVTPLPREPDEPVTLDVTTEPGAFTAMLEIESVEPVAADRQSDDPPLPAMDESSWEGWRCEVTGSHAGTAPGAAQCDPLRVEWEADRDAVVDLEVTFRVPPSAGSDVSASQSIESSAGPLVLRVRETSEFVASLLRLLGVVLAVVVAVRVLGAWARRRWAPISSPYFYTETVTPDGTGRLTGPAGRAPSIDRTPYEISRDLDSAMPSTELGGISLRVLWWPLILKDRVRIAAFSRSGDCVAPGGSKRRRLGRGGRYGVVGSSLTRGWVLETARVDPARLVFWDIPTDQIEAQARLEEILDEAARILPTEPPGASAPPAGTELADDHNDGADPPPLPHKDDPFEDDPFDDDPFGDDPFDGPDT